MNRNEFEQPLSFFTACMLLYCILSAPAYGQTTPHALSAEFVHSEKLAPLKGGIKVGQPLPDAKIESSTNGRWFEIPNWLGGVWRSIQIIRLSSYDEKTGEAETKTTVIQAREKETFGFQIDRNQNVWTCSNSLEPITYSTELKQLNAEGEEETFPAFAQITRENQLLNITGDRVTMRSNDVVVTFRKDNRLVQKVERRELLRSFVRISQKVIAVYSDVQTYDVFGNPEVNEVVSEFRKKEKDFKVQDEFKGVSLYSSFSKFLQSSGKLGLVPEKE